MRDQLLKSIPPLQSYIFPVGTVTFLPDGARLATGSADGIRMCWFKCPIISEETVLSSLLTEPRLSLWL